MYGWLYENINIAQALSISIIIFSTFFEANYSMVMALNHTRAERYKIALPVTGFIDVELCQL